MLERCGVDVRSVRPRCEHPLASVRGLPGGREDVPGLDSRALDGETDEALAARAGQAESALTVGQDRISASWQRLSPEALPIVGFRPIANAPQVFRHVLAGKGLNEIHLDPRTGHGLPFQGEEAAFDRDVLHQSQGQVGVRRGLAVAVAYVNPAQPEAVGSGRQGDATESVVGAILEIFARQADPEAAVGPAPSLRYEGISTAVLERHVEHGARKRAAVGVEDATV